MTRISNKIRILEPKHNSKKTKTDKKENKTNKKEFGNIVKKKNRI